jgi:hypothetical protein
MRNAWIWVKPAPFMASMNAYQMLISGLRRDAPVRIDTPVTLPGLDIRHGNGQVRRATSSQGVFFLDQILILLRPCVSLEESWNCIQQIVISEKEWELIE